MLIHESGEWISSTSSTPSKDATDPQKLGSAITYARRYALGAILSLNIDEDDDGQKAATAPAKKQTASVPKGERVIVADGDELFLKIVKAVSDGKGTIEQAKGKYNISEAVENSLKEKVQALSEIV